MMKLLSARASLVTSLLLAGFLGVTVSGAPSQTTGGVNWLDPLGYSKPAFYPITIPTPGTNRYWVDLGGGSGTSCTSTAPCSWSSVQGKPGTRGDGGAYIYIRGTGAIGSPTLYGTAGAEVVIKPWDDATTATISGRNNWTTQHQYVIWDGGPNLRIRFINTTGGQFDPSVYFNANGTLHSNITFYRTMWQVTGDGLWIMQWGRVQNLRIINSEFSAAGSSVGGGQHHIYLSGASNFGGSSGIYLLNNIIRDTPGESVEFRLFQNFSDVFIEGNAFHDIGKGTCSTNWKCRSAITFSTDGGGSFSGTVRVANNLIWDTGENCIRAWDNPSNTQFYNNTCYNWGSGPVGNNRYTSAAFANYSFTSGLPGDYRNNVIYATGTDPNGNAKTPFPGNASVGSFNACTSSTSCGGSKQTLSASSFKSLNENSPDFLKLVDGSNALGSGTLLSVISVDYLGSLRLGWDIGAIAEGSSGGSAVPVPPSNLRILTQ